MTENGSHSPSKGFRKLVAWQAAHDLVKATYQLTAAFPKTEQYGLVSQMRRAAVSVAANIVEGQAVNSTPSFLRYLAISFGSCKEVEYYLELAGELGYIQGDDLKRIQRLEGRAAYFIGSLSRGLKENAQKEAAKRGYKGQASAVRESLDTLDALDSLDSSYVLDSLDSDGDQ